jgi:hypothetical protein
MIADYFTKPLQGVLFRQLRDMIMGNVDIALPPMETVENADSTDGIPVLSTIKESRSVLGKVDEKPYVSHPTRAKLTVLGTRESLTGSTASQNVINNSKPVSSKPKLSWADIVQLK